MIASEDSERAILGSILMNEQAFDEASGLGLIAEDFGLDSHRRIYRHFEILARASTSIEIVTVAESLKTARELAAIGDVNYLVDLTCGVMTGISIRSYVKIVKESAAKRKMEHSCIATISGLGEDMSSSDAIEYMSDQILQIQAGSDDSPARRVSEFSESTYERWLSVASGVGDLVGLTTGMNCLDIATTGIREKELWVIGGRTGDGKTAAALQVVAANCRENIPVAFFSIEMPKESILHRIWAGEAQVNFNSIRFPRGLSSETNNRIRVAMREVSQWPLHIVEESGIHLQKLLAKSKLLIRRHGVKLIVIDYVQLITAAGRDERERITRVSKSLQCLAKESGIPVLVLSQLSRPKDGNENLRPVKYSLKESGSLENDPDVILLIYRPVDDRKMKTREDELIVEKQRSGLPSIERVTFLPWLRFAEREV